MELYPSPVWRALRASSCSGSFPATPLHFHQPASMGINCTPSGISVLSPSHRRSFLDRAAVALPNFGAFSNVFVLPSKAGHHGLELLRYGGRLLGSGNVEIFGKDFSCGDTFLFALLGPTNFPLEACEPVEPWIVGAARFLL